MDIRCAFIFSISIFIPVQWQVLDNELDEVILFWGNSNGTVCRMDINNNYSHVYIAFPSWIYPNSIDYDPVDHAIYWVGINNQISSGSLDGTSEKTVRSLDGFAGTYGLAVDSISRLLFYTDTGNLIIAVISLDGSLHKTVISSGLVNPRAIVTDPINGTIYWADSGSPGKIEKSDYDGTNRQELVNTGLSSPHGLAVDINAGVLYWCEIGKFTIERANVDGSNRFIIYQEQVTVSGCSIALYYSYLYFTFWGFRYALMRIGTDGRGLTYVASSADILPLGIHVHINGRLGINGCSNASGGCSHICFPLPGGYNECACPDFMSLQADGKTCRQDVLPGEFIIASDRSGVVRRIDINNNYRYFSIPFPNWLYAYDVDYDRTDGVIYWVNWNNQVNSGSIFGVNGTVLHFNGIAQTYGLAVDSISRLLFYTDSGNHIIAAISLKDFLQKTVISTGLVNPRAVVTDPLSGIIYWVDSGTPAKIERSNYDGTNRQEVVSTGLSTPFGLDVDINAGVLYWCEIGMFKIERANVDGTNRFLIYQEQISPSGCSVALYQSYIYFTTWRYSGIRRIGTDGSGLISVPLTAPMSPQAIHVNLNGQIGSNGCSHGSGGCSHFCFPQPGGSNVCACPNVMTLQPDGKSCHIDNIPENFLLVIDRSNRSIYRMDIDNYRYVSIPIQIGSSPYAIDYDPDAAVMFWSDVDFSQINYGSIYGNNQTTLRGFKNYAVLNGIAVDLTSRLLFYTDSVRNIIAVISLDEDLHRTVISDDLNTPQAIVTDPTNGTIYWSSRNKIEKSNYDGTSRQELINTGFDDYVDLAVDINVGIMYWCHYSTRIIELSNVDGSNRQVLYQDQTSLYTCSIALHQSYLYYIDSSQSVLMIIAINGSGITYVRLSIFHNVSDIHVHSSASKNQGVNGCSNERGGCSHLCFPKPDGSKVCDCPDYMTLQPDGLGCGNYTLPENFLLIMDPNNKDIYFMDILSYRYVTIAHENITVPYAITYDPIDRNIYWTDLRFRQIVSVSIHGDIRRTIRQLNISSIPAVIVADALSRLLFYIDYNNAIISAITMDGSMEKILINYYSRSYFLTAIAIDPRNGTMYWTAWGSSSKIEKSNYDGTNQQVVINYGLAYPFGLTIDIRGTNGCSSRNGGCSHFCFPRPGGLKVCDCPDGLTLLSDGHTCRSPTSTSETSTTVLPTTTSAIATSSSETNTSTQSTGTSTLSSSTSAATTGTIGTTTTGSSTALSESTTSEKATPTISTALRTSTTPVPSTSSPLTTSTSQTTTSSPSTTPQTTSTSVTSTASSTTSIPSKTTTSSNRTTSSTQETATTTATPDIDECSDNPCQNGGMCNNTDASYFCNCLRGWQGRNCSSDIDECSDNPCQNGGICNNTDGSYLCNCSLGWQGRNCSSDIYECSDNPCQNGGICNNTNGSYFCNCLLGWQGRNCSSDIDECSDNPCQNGGICTNTDGSYFCNCARGLQGQHCASDEYYLTTALAADIPISLLLIGAIIMSICVINRRPRTDCGAQHNVIGNVNETTFTTEPDVNRLDPISTETTNDQTGQTLAGDGIDDKSTGTPWQISAVGHFLNEKFRIKRPRLEQHPIRI